MNQKRLISFSIIFIITFIFSCIPCNCPEPKLIKFDFDMLFYNKKIIKSGAEKEIAFTVILIDSSKLVASLNKPKGAFMSQAMACSCNFKNYGRLQNSVKSIKIFTKNYFDSEYTAGADVTSLFVANDEYNQYTNALYKNLTQYATNLNNQSYAIEYQPPLKLAKQVALYLTKRPTANSSQFIVKFEFENGQISETETEIFN
jgi:hypothetical protein